MIKKYCKPAFLAMLCLLSAGIVFAQSSDETLNIATYYPSPSGNYNKIEVFKKAEVKNMVIGPEGKMMRRVTSQPPSAELMLMDDTGISLPRYDPAGYKEQFQFSDYVFTPVVRARELRITNWEANMSWKIKSGLPGGLLNMLPISLVNDSGGGAVQFNPSLGNGWMDCQNAIGVGSNEVAVLNNVFMIMNVKPSCFFIPNIPIGLCWGTISPFTFYRCLSHEAGASGVM